MTDTSNQAPRSPRLKPLFLSLALAFCGAPMVAQAAVINLTAEAGNFGQPRVVLIPQGGAYPYPADGFDYYASASLGNGGSYFFHTYGFAGNPSFFGARASGEQDFDLSTSATYLGTVTNNGTAAGMATFSFNVDSGDIGVYGQGVGQAGLLLQVLVNGNAVARSQTTVAATSTGVSCTENDLGSLSGYMACGSATDNSVFAAGGLFEVNLGMINPGETFNIQYDIISTASGQFTSGAVNCNYTDPGYGGYEGVEAQRLTNENNFFCPTFNAISRSGDPFNEPLEVVEPTSADFRTSISQVPEPSSLALLGAAGIAGLLARRRSRQTPR
jgi:hypothetical protein